MGFLSELRYPTKWYAKLITALLARASFVLLATATVSSYLLYRILEPARSQSEINTRDFPGRPEDLTFEVPGIGRRAGWFSSQRMRVPPRPLPGLARPAARGLPRQWRRAGTFPAQRPR